MASLRKLGKLWQVQVRRRGVRKSATFTQKAQAIAWAGRQESEIMAGARGEIPSHLKVSDILDRYAKEVSAHKKGARWEVVRLTALKRSNLASVRLKELQATHLSTWQLERSLDVASASVRRERNLLNHALNLAVREWGWLRENPFANVRRPRDSQPRNRLATQDEIDRIMEVASDNLKRAIVIAVETGMRAGEIAKIQPGDVVGRVVVLRDTKNGTSRQVPLTLKAVEVLSMPGSLSSGSISSLWAKACEAAKVEGLTFHDLRHYAITNLAKKLSVLELAASVGHRDLRMLQRYYNEPVSKIAEKLD